MLVFDEMGCYRGGLSPFDALHPVGCTLAFWGNENHKKYIYIGCLSAPAQRQHHVFHFGPPPSPSGITSVQQTGYRGSRVGEGRCHYPLLAVGLGLVFHEFFLARLWSVNLLVSFRTFLLCYPHVGSSCCPPGPRNSS